MKTIGYARISTADQRLSLQLDALKQAGCSRVFRDDGLSGQIAKRPGLERALNALGPGDKLVVWRLDRLGRSLKHLIAISEDLRARGVHFQSVMDAIDTATASGKLYFNLIAAISEYESNLISERTKAGMAAAKARGKHVGRPAKAAPARSREAR